MNSEILYCMQPGVRNWPFRARSDTHENPTDTMTSRTSTAVLSPEQNAMVLSLLSDMKSNRIMN